MQFDAFVIRPSPSMQPSPVAAAVVVVATREQVASQIHCGVGQAELLDHGFRYRSHLYSCLNQMSKDGRRHKVGRNKTHHVIVGNKKVDQGARIPE